MPDDASRLDRIETTLQQLSAGQANLKTAIEESELRLAAHLERAETVLLNGFRTYTIQQTNRTVALETRMNALEHRLIEIELRLMQQPPPQP